MPHANPISKARDELIAAVARVNVRKCGLNADAETCEQIFAELDKLALAYDSLVDAILRDLAVALPGGTDDPFKDECYGAASHMMGEFIGPALISAADACDEARWNYSAAADAADEAWSNRPVLA